MTSTQGDERAERRQRVASAAAEVIDPVWFHPFVDALVDELSERWQEAPLLIRERLLIGLLEDTRQEAVAAARAGIDLSAYVSMLGPVHRAALTQYRKQRSERLRTAMADNRSPSSKPSWPLLK
ncbi:hypothetical protein [Leifsonia xyli]|uniref:hypothetical protein n=1 Tax=Leifsonia xyli TaxID=1575 RepID=UPI003D670EC1